MRKITAKYVWQLLFDCYDDKSLLVGYYLQSVLSFRSLIKESATELWDMLDTVIESLFAFDSNLSRLLYKKLD